MAASTGSGFHIAPFGIDGEQLGLGFWETSQLSEAWLRICSEFLRAQGAACEASWSGNLSHIRTKHTSASGAAIATFFVHGKVATSLLLMSGRLPEAERTVSQIFVDSIQQSARVQTAASTPQALSQITSIEERPVLVVVAWAEPSISEQDEDLVRELGLHLAGAFFSENATARMRV